MPKGPRIAVAKLGDSGVNGYFKIRLENTQTLAVIASDGCGWEHVSVSRRDRCPTWREMCLVKALFWDAEDTVLQFHPKASNYVNTHPYCLHLWRRVGENSELPPTLLV